MALKVYTRRGFSEAEAAQRLDLQAKAGDLLGTLVRRFGRGISQVYFNEQAGRYVVEVSPSGEIASVREELQRRGLGGSGVRIADLDYEQRNALTDSVSQNLSEVIRAGHAQVALVASGVQITAAAGATPSELAAMQAEARRPHVIITESAKDDLTQHGTSSGCNGSYVDLGFPGRYCDWLRGGSRYFENLPNGSHGICTLGWWAGPADGSNPNLFVTAGHCIRGGTWSSCTAQTHSLCFNTAGYDIGQYVDPGNGDNGLLSITTGRGRESGYTAWANGARITISYYAFYPGVNTVICHGGATTGYACGTVSSNNNTVPINYAGIGTINMQHMITAEGTCVQGGDSGGPVFTGNGIGGVGMNVATTGCPGTGTAEPIWRTINTYGVYPYGA